MRFRRTLIPLAAAAVLLTACGSGSKDEATWFDEATSTSTTIDIRSRQVPEHPDAAYVSAVMKELEHVRGDIRREVFSTQSYSQATEDRIEDIYGGDVVDEAKLLWQKSSMKTHPEAVVIPGDENMINLNVLDARSDCVVFSADNDNSAVLAKPLSPLPHLIFQINRFESDNRTNPTPWKITVESVYEEGKKGLYTCDS